VQTPPDVFDKEFCRQFDRFTLAFDGFTRQASLVLGSVSPEATIRRLVPTSALRVADRALRQEWSDFTQRLNRISEDALLSHFAQIERLIGLMFSSASHFSGQRLPGGKRSVAIRATVKRLQALCVAVRDDTGQLFSNGLASFDQEKYDSQLQDFVRLVSALFDLHQLKLEVRASDGSPSRLQVANAAFGITRLITAAKSFPPLIARLQQSAIDLDDELYSVHQRLGLPFAISAVVTEPAGTGAP
jgi:hypothetical protein